MKQFLRILFASTLIFAGLITVAAAQDATPAPSPTPVQTKITFPIAELGNCASQVECRAYCNKPENMDACTAFASAHGIINDQQKEQNQKFSSALKQGGPGGCKTPDQCKTYCDDSSHTDECVAFAEAHNLGNKDHIDQAKKFGQIFKDGSGPGGCKSLGECKTFCSKAENLKTCADFAKQQNLLSADDSQKLEKFNQLVADGKTPGNCDSKDACEAYCKDASHRQECVDFGVKMGFLTRDQGDKIKKNDAMTGPGGCNNKEECESYCNSEEHHQECLQFAQEHGLADKQDVKNVKDAVNNIRTGIDNAPQEVKDCLKQTLDASTLDQIEQGEFTPTPEVGQQIKSCFEKFKGQVKTNIQHKFDASPEAQKCIVAATGQDALDALKNGQYPSDEQTAVKIKKCFEQSAPKPPARPNGISQGMPAGAAALKECLVKALGADKVATLDTKNLDDQTKAAIEKCRQQNSPSQRPADVKPSPTAQQGQQPDGEKIKKCLAEKLGEDGLKELQDPAVRNSEEMKKLLESCGYTQVIMPNSALRPGNGGQNHPQMQDGHQVPPPADQPPVGGQQPPTGNSAPTPPAEVKGASTELSWWQRAMLFFTGR